MDPVEYQSGDLGEADIGQILRALGDPIRLEIVRRLADGQPHAKSIEEWDLGLQKSALAHHFRSLRALGLTQVIVTGRTHAIQLRQSAINDRFPGLLDAILEAHPPNSGDTVD